MGSVPIYLANNIFKVEAGDKLKKEELFGIDGFTIKITMIKSRSNKAGQIGEFVYDQVNGVDNILSNLLYLKNNKILKGAGVGLYIESAPDVKFRLSTFKEKYKGNKEFRISFKKLLLSYYRTLINKSNDFDEEETESEEKVVKKTTKTKKKKS